MRLPAPARRRAVFIAALASLVVPLASHPAAAQPSLVADLEVGPRRFSWTERAWQVPGGYLLRTVDSGFVLWWVPAGDPFGARPILDEARSVGWDGDRLLVGGWRPGDSEPALWSVRGPEPELLVPGIRFAIFADRGPLDPGPADGFLFLGQAVPTGDYRFGLWRYDESLDSFTFLGPSGFPWGIGIPDPCRRTVTFGSTLLYCGSSAPWVSDGTASGTSAITPVTGPGATGWPLALTRTGVGRAIFGADGERGFESWVTDGTAAGTIPLGVAGTASEYRVGGAGVAWRGERLWSNPSYFRTGLFFARPDGTGVERLDSDGSALLVTDSGVIAQRGGWSEPCSALFGCEPWIWREAQGWELLADIAPGAESSNTFGWVAESGGRVLFGAQSVHQGAELWTSTGVPGTAEILVDLEPGPGSGLAPAGKIVPLDDGSILVSRVQGQPNGPATPWRVGSSGEDLGQVAELVAGTAGSDPEFFAVMAEQLLFWATVGAERHLWRSDTTAGGTRPVVGADGLSDCGKWNTFRVDEETVVGCDGGVYRVTAEGTLDLLARFDLGAVDTLEAPSIAPGISAPLEKGLPSTPWGGTTFARIGSRIVGAFYTSGPTRLLSLDLSTHEQETLVAQPQFGVSVPLTPFAGRLYFSWRDTATGTEVWSTDGTAAGTAPLGELLPGLYGSVQPLAVAGESLVLLSYYPDRLFWSDGTFAGTVPVVGVDGHMQLLLARKDGLCVAVPDGSAGKVIWIDSDGQASEVGSVPSPDMDVVPAGAESLLLSVGGAATEVWRTDCTALGTRHVTTLSAHESNGRPLLANGAIWLVVTNGGSARMLRIEASSGDTTEVGRWTLPVGSYGGSWAAFAEPIGDVLLFSIADERYGTELWRVDSRLLFADGFELGTTAAWSSGQL